MAPLTIAHTMQAQQLAYAIAAVLQEYSNKAFKTAEAQALTHPFVESEDPESEGPDDALLTLRGTLWEQLLKEVVIFGPDKRSVPYLEAMATLKGCSQAFENKEFLEVVPDAAATQLLDLADLLGVEVPSYEGGVFVCKFKNLAVPLGTTEQDLRGARIGFLVPKVFPDKLDMGGPRDGQVRFQAPVSGQNRSIEGSLRLEVHATGTGLGPLAEVILNVPIRVSLPGMGPLLTKFSAVARAV